MLSNFVNSQSAQLSSSGTSTHETGATFYGNPFRDLANSGINLHFALIRYYRGKSKRGKSVTGIFNICGRFYTCGANNYPEILHQLINKHTEYKRYVAECHQQKRERNLASRMKRMAQSAVETCENILKKV